MTPVRSTFAALAVTTALAVPAHAQVSGRFIGDVSVRTGYSANPFLNAGDDTGSFYGELSFMPSYILSEATSTTELNGSLRLTDYFERYSRTESYGLTARHQNKLDERTDAVLSIQLDSSVLGEQEILLGIPGEPDFPDPVDPDNPPSPGDVPDIPLIGTAQRQTTLGVDASVTRKFTALDSVTLGGGATRIWYETPQATDYRTYRTSLGYGRTLSERSTIGLDLGANWTEYDSGVGNAAVYTPRVTYSRRLSSSFSLDAAVGAQFIVRKDASNSIGFSGNIGLCRTDLRSSLCLTASQDAGGSGIGGVRKQTTAGLSYSYRLAEYDSLRGSFFYSKYGPSGGLDNGSEYVSAETSWERRISERLLGGVSLSYRNVYRSNQSTSADVGGQAFIRYSLGQLR